MGPPFAATAALFADSPPPDVMANTLSGLVDALSLVVGTAGIGVLLCGAYATAVGLIGSQLAAARGPGPKAGQEPTRFLFVPYLLLGLEFIIAAGVIKTLVHPDWQNVTVLGGIVLIRTVAGLSLHWEMTRDPVFRAKQVGADRPLPAPEGTNGRPLPVENGVPVPVQAAR